MSDDPKICSECDQPTAFICHGLLPGTADVWRSCQKPLCREHVAGTQHIHLNYGDHRSGWYDQPLCADCHARRQARIAEVQRMKAAKQIS